MPNASAFRRQVVEYWSRHQDECGLGIDWAEAHERCWRCGYRSALERCHIIPKSLGGSSSPSNLVLLCGRCHREAPNVSDARFMWIWLRTTCVPFYDLYWTARGVQEFEAMFGRKPFSNPELEGIPEAHAYEVLREEMDKAIVHFGEGRMNPSTIASVLALVEERLTGRVAEPAPFSASSRALFAAIGWATPK